MKTQFVKFPKNDITEPHKMGIATESKLYEMSCCFTDKPNSKYWLTCFKCGVTANLGDHEVIIENNIITISPSILCPRKECGNHYYIKNSEVIPA